MTTKVFNLRNLGLSSSQAGKTKDKKDEGFGAIFSMASSDSQAKSMQPRTARKQESPLLPKEANKLYVNGPTRQEPVKSTSMWEGDPYQIKEEMQEAITKALDMEEEDWNRILEDMGIHLWELQGNPDLLKQFVLAANQGTDEVDFLTNETMMTQFTQLVTSLQALDIGEWEAEAWTEASPVSEAIDVTENLQPSEESVILEEAKEGEMFPTLEVDAARELDGEQGPSDTPQVAEERQPSDTLQPSKKQMSPEATQPDGEVEMTIDVPQAVQVKEEPNEATASKPEGIIEAQEVVDVQEAAGMSEASASAEEAESEAVALPHPNQENQIEEGAWSNKDGNVEGNQAREDVAEQTVQEEGGEQAAYEFKKSDVQEPAKETNEVKIVVEQEGEPVKKESGGSQTNDPKSFEGSKDDGRETPHSSRDAKGTPDSALDAFVQNLAGKTENHVVPSDRVAQLREIVTQVVEQIKILVKPGESGMEITLNPEHLGKVNLSIVMKAGVATASFLVQNETVKEALQSQIQSLKDNLQQQGLKVESIEVNVSDFSFEHSRNSNGYEAQGNKRQQRKFSDGLGLDGDGVEESVDSPNAASTRSNGSLVDFIA